MFSGTNRRDHSDGLVKEMQTENVEFPAYPCQAAARSAQVGWTKAAELTKVARSDWRRFWGHGEQDIWIRARETGGPSPKAVLLRQGMARQSLPSITSEADEREVDLLKIIFRKKRINRRDAKNWKMRLETAPGA
jgi:hypothetical protein